jgi:outer membrane protein TolC
MIRSRWRVKLTAGLAALAGLGGCKQQVFLDKADFQEAMYRGFPTHFETQPYAAVGPVTHLDQNATLPTVLDPTRPPQYVSLKQCIAIGLEQGNIGSGGTTNAGFGNDSIGQFTGRGFSGTDSIKALVLDPAVAQVDIERSVSKFDARFIGSMIWQNQDQPTPNLFSNFNVGDRSTLTTSLLKPLPTGGVAGITWSVDYTNLTNAPTNLTNLNKYYVPRLQFSFEQPLMQGYGIEINQIAPQHPGSVVTNLRTSGGSTTEGILITRIRYDQQRAEFDRQVNQFLLGVESAYWNLYAAYYNLYASEYVLAEAAQLLYVVYQRVYIAQNLRAQQYWQTEAQFNQLRQQVISARQQVLQNERQLRSYLGMRTDDKVRLVPADDPNLVLLVPNHYDAAMTALAQRPELLQARQEIKAQQLNLILQKNNRRPDVRFISSYDIAGIGPRLDGPESVNALANFANNQFNSWTLGFRADIPIGFRDANGAVRQAQLGLQRSYWTLAEGERKAIETVYTEVQNVLSNYEQVKFTKSRRNALAETLRLDNEVLRIGTWDVPFLNQLLINQQNYVQALSDEFRLIGEYQKALAALEFAKGTIQQYDNVSVAEGALPANVQKKAADHFRERDAAIKVREHPAQLPLPPLCDLQPIDLEKMVPPTPPANPASPGAPADPVTPTGPGKLPAAALTTPIAAPLPTAKPIGSLDALAAPADADAAFTPGGTVVIPPLKVTPGKR